jgi:hypothetical protein
MHNFNNSLNSKNMKKILLILALAISFGSYSFAQEIGVRLGNISGGNVAIDAMIGTAKFSRIHGDISFGKGVGIDLLWDFLYRPLKGEAFNWYVGAGPYTQIDDPFMLGVVAEAGLEYRFAKAPIALGLDYRPQFSIISDVEFSWGGFGFNARYVFGKKK